MGHSDRHLHALIAQAQIEQNRLPTEGRMYAIAFDLDTDKLKANYPTPSWNNAYGDIEKSLAQFGFSRQQGSVYFGNEKVTAVICVLAAQKLSAAHSWFKPCVRDIRMLRIEEFNDLAPAI